MVCGHSSESHIQGDAVTGPPSHAEPLGQVPKVSSKESLLLPQGEGEGEGEAGPSLGRLFSSCGNWLLAPAGWAPLQPPWWGRDRTSSHPSLPEGEGTDPHSLTQLSCPTCGEKTPQNPEKHLHSRGSEAKVTADPLTGPRTLPAPTDHSARGLHTAPPFT